MKASNKKKPKFLIAFSMVQVFGIHILKSKGDQEDPLVLLRRNDLSSFAFFKRGTAEELINFFVRTVAKRTNAGGDNLVQQNEYFCHCKQNAQGLICCVD